MTQQYDVASVRGLYTGLSDGWTYLNAHSAPQIAERVASGVARSFRTSATVKPQEDAAGAHSARRAPGELLADDMYSSARRAVADLTGATADRVILGPSLSVLYQSLAAALRPLLRRQSSVVLSRFDPPELSGAFAHLNADIRWAQPDLGTGVAGVPVRRVGRWFHPFRRLPRRARAFGHGHADGGHY